MPKGGKGKRKDKDRRDAKPVPAPSDEDVTDDAWSVMSVQSEGSIVPDTDAVQDGGNDEVDESSAQENFEDKLKEVIDGLSQKSTKARVDSLKSLKTGLAKKYLPDFILGRKMTISDGLEKCLKKGKGEEQALAAINFILLMIQLGNGPDTEELYKIIQPVLVSVTLDNSAALKARAACAEALGLTTFIGAAELEDVSKALQTLENIFRASYLKGDGSVPSVTPETADLHTSALLSWCLLLTISQSSSINKLVDSHLPKLCELLQSGDVELRIAAGEAIALIYELVREEDEDFMGDNIEELEAQLKQLATDGNKYRSKKDRKQQRSSFRDILKAVQEGFGPDVQVKFGLECLYIETWSRKRQYDSVCQVLGSAMNTHLQENELVRDTFELGAAIPLGAMPSMKTSKSERHLYNAAAFKARTKSRSKFRDKRSAVIGGE